MAQITSHEELEEWLKDKPADWTQVVAVRAALRLLPHAFSETMPNDWVAPYSLSVFRALAISWAARNSPAYGMEKAAGDAAIALNASVYAPNDPANFAFNAAVAAFNSSVKYSIAADPNTSAWLAQTDDYDWLVRVADPIIASHRLTFEKLWPVGGVPQGWHSAWYNTAKHLLTLDPTYQVWIDWYNRRIEGHKAAFDIPGDHDRTEDKAILARLADATNEDFWDKGATDVNTTLQRWIEEARERVRPRDAPFVTDPLRQLDAEPEPIPPQNQNAIPFTASEDGKIRIDERRNVDALRTDGDAQDRHSEAIREAKALLDRCRLSNSAARFVSGFENYLAAGGDTLADLRPSLFVQRGEKLRQEIAAYEGSEQDSFLEPIADDLLIDLKGWRSAHNMAVGLDPVLMRIDTAMLGPDVKPTLIAPSELHAFVADADEADILDNGVREIVDEAIDLAPDVPDANDRRTVWSFESVQNLVIEAFSVALNYPVKVAVGVAFTAAVGVKVAAGVAGGALVSAKFLIKHRTWIETRLNNTPTWQSLFNQVCDRLEEWTPFKSSKDDDGV